MAPTDRQTASTQPAGGTAPDPEASPARLYALVVGGALVLGGIAGFLYEASFATGAEFANDEILGILSTNGWHNLVHLATGLLGLVLASRAARTYALGLGLVYLIIAIWGFAVTDHGVGDLLGLVPLNGEDNVLHLAIGVSGLAAGLASGGRSVLRAPRIGRGRQRSRSRAAGSADLS